MIFCTYIFFFIKYRKLQNYCVLISKNWKINRAMNALQKRVDLLFRMMMNESHSTVSLDLYQNDFFLAICVADLLNRFDDKILILYIIRYIFLCTDQCQVPIRRNLRIRLKHFLSDQVSDDRRWWHIILLIHIFSSTDRHKCILSVGSRVDKWKNTYNFWVKRELDESELVTERQRTSKAV